MERHDESIDDIDERKELAPGVILIKEFKKQTANDSKYVGSFVFSVEINTMSLIEFEVDLEQSENIELDGVGSNEIMTKTTKIFPFERKKVAVVRLKKDWRLKTKFKLSMNLPEISVQHSYIREDEMNLKDLIGRAKTNFTDIPFDLMEDDEIVKELRSSKMNFIDLDFPPQEQSMVMPNNAGKLKEMFDYIVHWRRPKDFFGDNLNKVCIYQNEEPEPNDITNGLLPDNYLVASFSALAERHNLVSRLIKAKDYNEYGFYTVKLCIGGEWVSVIIDDYFPCFPKGIPMLSRSPHFELWVLILSKALAKAVGSYFSMTLANTLNISDYLLMLTGCPSFYVQVEDMIRYEEKSGLFDKLKSFVVEKKYLVIALSQMEDDEEEEEEEEDDGGLTLKNNGYTVLNVSQNPDLITLRNPWPEGKKEETIERYHEKLSAKYPSIKKERENGNLVMTHDQFVEEFPSFVVSYVKNWEEVRIRGKFLNLNVFF